MNKETRKKVKLFAWKYFIVDVARILAAPSVFLFLRPKWLYENENAKKTIRVAAVNNSGVRKTITPVLSDRWRNEMCLKGPWAQGSLTLAPHSGALLTLRRV